MILNGAIEISHPEGRAETLCMGNSFGIAPSLDKQYMNGEVRTKGDDCQVNQRSIFTSVCRPQKSFFGKLCFTFERGLKVSS